MTWHITALNCSRNGYNLITAKCLCSCRKLNLNARLSVLNQLHNLPTVPYVTTQIISSIERPMHSFHYNYARTVLVETASKFVEREVAFLSETPTAFSLNPIVHVRRRRRRRHELCFFGISRKLFELATSNFNTT